MERLLLLFTMTFLAGSVAIAQCTPDPQYISPGFYPDSATGFDSVIFPHFLFRMLKGKC